MKGYRVSMVVEGAGMNVWILHRKPHEMEIVGSRSEEAAPPFSAGSANAEHGTE